MKKALLVITLLFLFGAIVHAQITKGAVLLGGGLAYNQSAGYVNNNILSPGKQHYATINPSVGVVVRENVVVGVEPNINWSNQKVAGSTPTDITTYKGRSYGASVFIRRYVPLLKRFYFYAQGAVGGNKNKSWQEYNSQTTNSTNGWGAGLSLSPGLTYSVTRKLYIESGLNGFAVLAYARSNSKYTDPNTGMVSTSKGNMFNFSTSLGGGTGLNIGFRLLL